MSRITQIEVLYNHRQVGRLALTKEGLCAFTYAAEWLDGGFSISPLGIKKNYIFKHVPHNRCQ